MGDTRRQPGAWSLSRLNSTGCLSSAPSMDRIPLQHPPFVAPPVQFQMPQFVLGGTPNVALGGGAEVLPCMYGQGTQAWSDYDKNWYEHGASKYYSFEDLVTEPSSSGVTASRPFEFTDSPHVHSENHSPSPSPAMRPMEMDDEEETFVEVAPPAELTYPQEPLLAPYAQYPPISLSTFALPTINSLDPTAPLPPIPSNGLPLYSASGFDMLKMLGKVATRPNPKIMLGPVDMTCSFVVVDVRRFDAPIVYASPTFSRLTGYPESEVLGRNCRFLQGPSGQVARGEERRFTAPDAVRHLQKCLLQEKECQASLINYRKDGGAFINLVTVIPIAADDNSDDITHHVGFQVDLAEQPNAILQKLRDGSYIVNYSNSGAASGFAGVFGREARRGRGVSQEMVDILRSGKNWMLSAESSGAKPVRDHERAALHAMLLENTDDFIHVVSLKGALLYVAPAIQRVLGYDPTELLGKSIADICHPADIVPLMRELKEASSTVAPPPPTRDEPPPLFALPQQQHLAPPKPVNLLFRARHKTEGYVWLEARGRLHVEQGKGRKAVVLVGRRTRVPRLRWGTLAPRGAADCWGLVAPNGLVLSASGVGAVHLGYGPDGAQLVGRSLASLVAPEDSRRVVEVLAGAACADKDEARRVQCAMLVHGAAPHVLQVELLFYAHEREPSAPTLPPSLVFQLRLAAPSPRSAPRPTRAPDADVLEDLDTARETSWQYELTRLRFENQRMRDEVAALERMHGHPPLPRRQLAPSPVMSSLGGPAHAPPLLKRTHNGEMKLLPASL